MLPASTLETEIFPARVEDFSISDLDELCAAGEIVWRGFETLGAADGKVACYLTDHYGRLSTPAEPLEGELYQSIRDFLQQRGASFFDDLAQCLEIFRNDLLSSLWDLVWNGEVTNDTLAPLRSLRHNREQRKRTGGARPGGRRFRSRRISRLPGSEGRWSLLPGEVAEPPTATEQQTALAAQLIERYGVVTRELVTSEGITGGFSGLYPIFKAMEEAGKIRRGYFVAGLGAAQFAAPGAEDRLREVAPARSPRDEKEIWVLAATDPANPYGAALPWPDVDEGHPRRVTGAKVILFRGDLIAYLAANQQSLLTFLPDAEPDRTERLAALMHVFGEIASSGSVIYLTRVDGVPPAESPFGDILMQAGFTPSAKGFQLLTERSRT